MTDSVDPPDVDELFTYRPELDAPITGPIPTIERQAAHHAFVEAVTPSTVLLPITEARKLAHDGISAAEWLPDDATDTTIITSTTVSDDQLTRISWEKELDIVLTVAPDYHIPTDYPVYGDDPPDDREYNCARCAAGTAWMADQLAASDANTSLIPLIKGTTPDERAICERQAGNMDVDMIAVYGGQYFGAGGGGGRSRLVEDVAAINTETATFPTLVIGGLSPWVGNKLPKNVVATAGLRAWRSEVRPRSATATEMHRRYTDLVDEVETALNLDASVRESTDDSDTDTDADADTDAESSVEPTDTTDSEGDAQQRQPAEIQSSGGT